MNFKDLNFIFSPDDLSPVSLKVSWPVINLAHIYMTFYMRQSNHTLKLLNDLPLLRWSSIFTRKTVRKGIVGIV
uniref:Uncharacterized protein n=1 Tax=Lutzomyia longipalpis TaxID=7200 RepID=A0A7G3B419_LUTLO